MSISNVYNIVISQMKFIQKIIFINIKHLKKSIAKMWIILLLCSM